MIKELSVKEEDFSEFIQSQLVDSIDVDIQDYSKKIAEDKIPYKKISIIRALLPGSKDDYDVRKPNILVKSIVFSQILVTIGTVTFIPLYTLAYIVRKYLIATKYNGTSPDGYFDPIQSAMPIAIAAVAYFVFDFGLLNPVGNIFNRFKRSRLFKKIMADPKTEMSFFKKEYPKKVDQAINGWKSARDKIVRKIDEINQAIAENQEYKDILDKKNHDHNTQRLEIKTTELEKEFQSFSKSISELETFKKSFVKELLKNIDETIELENRVEEANRSQARINELIGESETLIAESKVINTDLKKLVIQVMEKSVSFYQEQLQFRKDKSNVLLEMMK